MSEMTFDNSGDGVLDTVEMTGAAGDGYAFATGIDADQNGLFETVHVDLDGDHIAEATVVDIDHNGVLDSAQIDQSGNTVADTYLYDTDGDSVFDVTVADVNENGVADSEEVVPAGPGASTMPTVPTPSEVQSLIAQNPISLIGLYEQILNTPVDPTDDAAVANKAQVLSMVAEMVSAQQAATMGFIATI